MKVRKMFSICVIIVFLCFTLINLSFAGDLMGKVMENDLKAVKQLLDAGADVNERDESSGSTPLMMACSYRDYTEMVKLLLSYKPDLNIQDKVYGTTALIAAVGISKEVVEMLLANGADITIKRFDGTSPFLAAISGILSGRVTTDLLSLLLSKGSNINETFTSGPAEGYTGLMMAARNESPELVKFLVKNGANINAKAKDGSTALSLANKENDAAMVKLLKELGAKQ